MKLLTLITPLALAATLALSGGAMAQAMIGDVQIPADSLTKFQEKCSAIASASTESLAGALEDQTETGSVVDPNAQESGDQANKDNLDQLLASITVDQCKEAGLLPGGPTPATSNVN